MNGMCGWGHVVVSAKLSSGSRCIHCVLEESADVGASNAKGKHIGPVGMQKVSNGFGLQFPCSK